MNDSLTFEKKELKFLLEREFFIHIDSFEDEDYAKARRAIFVYENADEFFEATGWERNNPELRTEDYLTENRVCRWWNGRFIYFSRIFYSFFNSIFCNFIKFNSIAAFLIKI